MSTTEKGIASDDARARKLGLSCAECRRSKLKCDRAFPCQSCIRRGCAAICPEGTLAATKGNKVLMAQNQRLSEQVKSLSSRIRELEAAQAQSTSEQQSAPNRQHSVTNDTAYENKAQDISEAMGSLSLGTDGQVRFRGYSAGSEYLQDLLPRSNEDTQSFKPSPFDLRLPTEIIALLHAFPLGFKDCPYSKSIFTPYLPMKQRAVELAAIYYRNVAWMYDPISHEDFVLFILNPIYGNNGYPSTDTLHSHRLSVFFVVLASGSYFESTAMAEQYYILAKAAFSLTSILQEVTCATVQALFLAFRFIYDSDQTSKEERWLLTGISTRIAHMIGLLGDSAAWNLNHDEVQRRRRLFWELFTWDSWSCLVNGRAGAIAIRNTDCQFAEDLDPSVNSAGEAELGFHAWKFRYSATCLSISVEHVFSTRAPPYTALLAIDKTIRTFPIPTHLRPPTRTSDGASWSSDPMRALQQYCALCVRESNLLYIHRSYFAQAIRDAPDNPLQHKYAPSILVTYQSACRLITNLRSLYPSCPLVRQVWFFWSGVFSSCVVLGVLVIESPGCTLAKDAFRELEATLSFFDEGSMQCRPPSTLAFLQKLYDRASSSYAAFKAGRGDRVAPSSGYPNEPDELEVLGGRKSVITTNSNVNSPSIRSPSSPPAGDGGNSPSNQCGPAEMPIEYYQQMDTPKRASSKDYDLEIGEPAHHFEDQSYPKYMESSVSPSTTDNYMTSHPPTTAHSDTHFVTSHTEQPQTAYSWYAYPAEQFLHQSPPSAFTSYQNPPNNQSSHPPMAPLGPLPYHQAQEEIWRNFILTFGG